MGLSDSFLLWCCDVFFSFNHSIRFFLRIKKRGWSPFDNGDELGRYGLKMEVRVLFMCGLLAVEIPG